MLHIHTFKLKTFFLCLAVKFYMEKLTSIYIPRGQWKPPPLEGHKKTVLSLTICLRKKAQNVGKQVTSHMQVL